MRKSEYRIKYGSSSAASNPTHSRLQPVRRASCEAGTSITVSSLRRRNVPSEDVLNASSFHPILNNELVIRTLGKLETKIPSTLATCTANMSLGPALSTMVNEYVSLLKSPPATSWYKNPILQRRASGTSNLTKPAESIALSEITLKSFWFSAHPILAVPGSCTRVPDVAAYGTAVGVLGGVGVAVGVGCGVGVAVGVDVSIAVGVGVLVEVGVGSRVGVALSVGFAVDVGVAVGVSAGVGVGTGVQVGSGAGV